MQSLSRNIESNDREGPQQPVFSSPRSVNWPKSTSSLFDPRRPPSWAIEHQQTVDEPQQVYPYQSDPLSQTDQYNEHYSDALDDYDRALLAEPQFQLQWEHNSSSGTIAPGRMSLPGHTAPYTPRQILEQPTAPRRLKTKEPSSGIFKAKLSQFMHTPPNKIAVDSSSSVRQPSSPLLNASRFRPTQRREPQVPSNDTRAQSARPWPTTTSNTKKTRTNGIPRNERDDRMNEEDMSLAISSPCAAPMMPLQARTNLSQPPPIIQGIQLVSTNDLPDRFRSIFPFNPFNAIQSKCFHTAYKTSDNLVLSAPTGGGKTVIFELAICHLVSGFENSQYKIVYMAPTKSLCSERQRDWQAKFAVLDLVCAELTGDTDFAHLRSVQSASIMITTPEKWDSMTRQWKDHAKLMQLVKLVLVDEVHMLKDNRGATLEAVVSRMKSVGSDVRFIALSATVPNSEDVACWLGRNHTEQHLPAIREVFGDKFRPVKLQKHIVGLPYKGNDYGFEGVCDLKLPNIIAKYGLKKPLMVFCITRKAAQTTAKFLANLWASNDPRDRQWQSPTMRIAVSDPDLMNTLPSAVAFHHAGLDSSDRHAVEQGYLNGQIGVICCTSTLAVGVNLPCHLVIIKNTMSYQNDGLQEYAELEIMQMLGRAGRPQFDDSAVAVIITKQEKVKKYEQLVTGSELLESCLHLNLIDHLNAEIGLGTIYDLHTAKRWLAGTFFYVRLRKNPEYYRLDEDTTRGDLGERIERICQKDLELLRIADLVTIDRKIQATDLGHIMARYYVQYKTMKTLLSLGPRSKISDILSSLVQAEEYHEIRLRAFEKKLFKDINNSTGIKFPVKVDLAIHAHKRSLLIQSELGGVEFPADEQHAKHKRTFQTEKRLMFSNVHRLVRCVVDIFVHLQDAVSARHALELARSLSAGVWDNSPFQMQQISQIGPVAIRKLTLSGISSIEALETAEPHRIELLLSKNPPFGSRLLSALKDFPKLRVSIKRMDKDPTKSSPVCIKIKLECGFINDRVPLFFNKKMVYVCILTERSDGHLIDFRRISARKLNSGQDVPIIAEMTSHTQHITCYVMCEEIAGTMRFAELKPSLPAHLFSSLLPQPQRRPQQIKDPDSSVTLVDDEFGVDEIDDQDIIDAVEEQDFKDIEDVVRDEISHRPHERSGQNEVDEEASWHPQALNNGKWSCNHKCKDKTACKHLCCREGLDKAPKRPKSSSATKDTPIIQSSQISAALPKDLPVIAKAAQGSRKGAIDKIDLANEANSSGPSKANSRHMRGLVRLHQSVTKGSSTPVVRRSKPSHAFCEAGQLQLSFPKEKDSPNSDLKQSTDYSEEWMNHLPSPSELLGNQNQAQDEEEVVDDFEDHHAVGECSAGSEKYGTNQVKHWSGDYRLTQLDDDEFEMEAAMVGLHDSFTMKELSKSPSREVGKERSQQLGSSKIPPSISTLPFSSTYIDSTGVSQSDKTFHPSNDTTITMPLIPEKKRHTEAFLNSVDDSTTSSGATKRQKNNHPSTDEASTQTKLDGPSSLENPQQDAEKQFAPTSVPIIKPGQPAWVYDFDPAFIAEYQDIVEFV